MSDDAPMTATDAESAIQANFQDADFMSAYNNRHDPAHQEKIERMRDLHRVAAGEGETSSTPAGDEPVDEPVVSGVDDAEKRETEAWMESEYGVHHWQEVAEAVHETLLELAGQEGVDALVDAGRGNDHGLIQELWHISTMEDRTGFPAKELWRRLWNGVAKTVDGARAELWKLNHDPDFMDKWLAGDVESVETMRSLQFRVDLNHMPEVIGA